MTPLRRLHFLDVTPRALAEAIQEAYATGTADTSLFGRSETCKEIEQGVHELAHCATLKITPSLELSADIGVRLEKMPFELSDMNEARTCAVELIVMRTIGMELPLWKLVADAWESKRSEIEVVEAVAIVDEFQRTEAARAYAWRVLQWLRAIAPRKEAHR